MDKIAKDQLERICSACGWWFKEEDQKVALCIVKALRALDVLRYRDAKTELNKACKLIVERRNDASL